MQAQEIIDHWKPKPESSLRRPLPTRERKSCSALIGIFGEVVDPSTWPASAIGVVTVAHFSNGGWCTGTLVAPRIVLTAAHCLLNGIELISPGNVHFLARHEQGNAGLVLGRGAVRRGEGFRSDLDGTKVDARSIAGRLGADRAEGRRAGTASRGRRR